MVKKHSEATKRKISLAQRGRKNSFYGHRHKKSTRALFSQNNRGKNNPMFGHRHSEATKEKIRRAALKRLRKSK